MKWQNGIVSIFLILLVFTFLGIGPPVALAIDEAKIPHYFGPYANWALSPLPVNNNGAITGGIRKFMDRLPMLGSAGVNNLGQYLPVAVPDTTTYPGADYYEIGLVQYREKMHSNIPATLLRGYVQLSTTTIPGRHIQLSNANLGGGTTAIAGYFGVDNPHYLGPIIVATKDRPVRILFRNLLPTGAGGDLFLPVDSTMMGSGMGPMNMADPADQRLVTDEVRNPACTQYPKSTDCFKDNRATLHLHGGTTPWISDGTPHQWTSPAGEDTSWPKGVAVQNVPDMPDPGPGALTFFYTNQQSARLLFYHDHAWGITRLNVYAGEAAGYLITDPTETALINNGLIPGAADTIPLIVQDRTFVPNDTQLYGTPANGVYGLDPTWDKSRWGGEGNLWYHHVYMPAENPGDASGMSAYGRWFFGPWFWPPATPVRPPIANPRYNMDPATNFETALPKPCDLNDPTSWQYQTDPFCEPQLIPGTPNISVGMEQFNDTPVVNGTVYPTVTLEPKSYRLRILNAANDRFFNLQWYVGDNTTASTSHNAMGQSIGATEVAFKAAELAAAQDDPNVFPTPDTTLSPVGPSWIQIGTEGGFLPAPVVIPSQPMTWITDPTRFDVGNADQHSLLLAPAERADVIVDFSAYAGKTLILYNDAPAAFPARIASYDYYTGAPDLSPVGAPGVLPGYGPNTRTIMQVKISGATAASFNLTALQNAFMPNSQSNATGLGVFLNGQHPIIVGQAAYNSAYGASFLTNSWCNAPGSALDNCDGYARISDQGGDQFGFNTLLNPLARFQLPIQPKALHDEMNAVAFDEFGRMTANIGIEAVPASPAAQNVTLYPYVNPATELIDATNLPQTGPAVTPIATQDGTQIWKITHNGVDTHPIHFHLYDVQLLNRVTWDNIIIPPDANELGWKDTVRVSPLEDTIVALRPVIPTLPFEIPNSIRHLNPMMPPGSTLMFNNIDVNGNPTAPITNILTNFGWEYVWHCHILSHEEMDMMRPVSVAIPPKKPDGLTYSIDGSGLTLNWNDNSINETSFLVQKTADNFTWTDVGSSPSPLDQPNTTGIRNLTDPNVTDNNVGVGYRVVAQNTVGYGGQYPGMTVTSVSDQLTVGNLPPAAPTLLTAVIQAGPQVNLSFTDNAADETGFVVERAANGGQFVQIATLPVNTVTYADTNVATGNTYNYRVAAVNGSGQSGYSNVATAVFTPNSPTTLTAILQAGPQIMLSFTDNTLNETGFAIERAANNGQYFRIATAPPSSPVSATGNVSYIDTNVVAGNTFNYRVATQNSAGTSTYSNVASVAIKLPATPTPLIATLQKGTLGPQVRLMFYDRATNENGFAIERSANGGAYVRIATAPVHAKTGYATYYDTSIVPGNAYKYRVAAENYAGLSGYSNVVSTVIPAAPNDPSNFTATNGPNSGTLRSIILTWTDNSTNETGFSVQRATDAAFTTGLTTTAVAANAKKLTQTALKRNTSYWYRIRANNGAIISSGWVAATPFPITTNP